MFKCSDRIMIRKNISIGLRYVQMYRSGLDTYKCINRFMVHEHVSIEFTNNNNNNKLTTWTEMISTF